MLQTIKMEVKPEEIIRAVKKMRKNERDAFIEDLLTAISSDYLDSIKQARTDYKAGRIKTHEEVFGH